MGRINGRQRGSVDRVRRSPLIGEINCAPHSDEEELEAIEAKIAPDVLIIGWGHGTRRYPKGRMLGNRENVRELFKLCRLCKFGNCNSAIQQMEELRRGIEGIGLIDAFSRS